MSTITERAEQAAAAAGPATCDAVIEWFGMTWPCDQPSIGLYRRICVHEHVREGWLCRGHVDQTPVGRCQTCFDLGVGLSHDCPINLAEVGA